MNFEALNIKLSYPLILCGAVAIGIGVVWMLIRAFRRGRPLLDRIAAPFLLVGIGIVAMATPSVISRLVPIDLGPLDKIVNGERHLTLTGWDRHDYELLRDMKDVTLLQMGNADVTDATIDIIAGYGKLRELDVSDSQVTDAGLEKIARLTTLETLYLNNTKVTAAGVEKFLTHLPALRLIWLRGMNIPQDTADRVKAGKAGRRVNIGQSLPHN